MEKAIASSVQNTDQLTVMVGQNVMELQALPQLVSLNPEEIEGSGLCWWSCGISCGFTAR